VGHSLIDRQGPFSQPDPHFQSGPVPQYQQHDRRQAFMSSSQPITMGRPEVSELDYSQLSEEPSMSQFTSNPHLPESMVIFSITLSTDILDSTCIAFQRLVSPRETDSVPLPAPSPRNSRYTCRGVAGPECDDTCFIQPPGGVRRY